MTCKLWNLYYLSNQTVFSTLPKNQDKNLNISRIKRAFKTKQKAFFITFNGLLLRQVKYFFQVEGPTLMFIIKKRGIWEGAVYNTYSFIQSSRQSRLV